MKKADSEAPTRYETCGRKVGFSVVIKGVHLVLVTLPRRGPPQPRSPAATAENNLSGNSVLFHLAVGVGNCAPREHPAMSAERFGCPNRERGAPGI